MNDKERRAAFAKLKVRYDKLQDPAYSKDTASAQERGRLFEKLICDVFGFWKLLRRNPYHTGDNRSEQIDGAISFGNRHVLLEAKWKKTALAASDLFAFLGKVESKFVGTIGIFISKHELTDNFLTALRAGRRQSIMVIHGADVDTLFEDGFDLTQYLHCHLEYICLDNQCHLSTETYLAIRDSLIAEEKAVEKPKDDQIKNAFKECISDPTAKNVVHEYVKAFSKSERIEAVDRLVKKFAPLFGEAKRDQWLKDNFDAFLKELLANLPKKLTEADSTFFEKLSRDFQSRVYGPMTKHFAGRYQYLSNTTKDTVEGRLTKQWEDIIGDWNSENRMANATEPIWKYLQKETQAELIRHFVTFVLSDRRTSFEQRQLADTVLRKKNNNDGIDQSFVRHACTTAKSWLEEYGTEEKGIRVATKRLKSILRNMESFVTDYDKLIATAVKKTAKQIDKAAKD